MNISRQGTKTPGILRALVSSWQELISLIKMRFFLDINAFIVILLLYEWVNLLASLLVFGWR